MSSTVTNLVLNQDQEAAANGIFQFLLSDDKEYAVSGPAGTGKTTLMHHVRQQLLPDYERACQLIGIQPKRFEIELTATTNKAAEVLSQTTGFPASTIHAFMGLKVYDDHTTGVSKISRGKGWQVHSHKLIFIDEASMVDQALYDFLHQGTDKTCKIIYLGDRCQMAPIFEKISPVYRNQKHAAELRTPVRNAGQPALMNLCNQLRENVDTLEFQPIDPVPGVIEYLDDAQAQAFIDQTFATEGVDARILCYANARVNEYNQYIRNLRGYPEHFVPGERVISATGAQVDPNNLLRVEEEFKIEELDPVPQTIKVGMTKEDVDLDVYQTKIRNFRRGTISVRIPAHPEHHKALMRYFKTKAQWPAFYWLKNSFPDLRPKDAATVYKAQGSTYETVFLDLGNIGKCTDDDQVARMLYVGASRATTRLYLYGQLPTRFQNRIAA